jgi:hypothetical protein
MMMSADETQKPDGWHDWKPQWSGSLRQTPHNLKNATPHDLQEKHSPTAPVAVHVAAHRLPQLARRRLVDARLWGAMTPAQQDAATQVAAAFEMIGRGMNFATSDWQRIPGCRSAGDVADRQARMTRDYMEWAKKCTERKISHAMVVDVLCFGFSCRLIDRDRRLKSGSTRKNLMKGLSLYCELRGWE